MPSWPSCQGKLTTTSPSLRAATQSYWYYRESESKRWVTMHHVTILATARAKRRAIPPAPPLPGSDLSLQTLPVTALPHKLPLLSDRQAKKAHQVPVLIPRPASDSLFLHDNPRALPQNPPRSVPIPTLTFFWFPPTCYRLQSGFKSVHLFYVIRHPFSGMHWNQRLTLSKSKRDRTPVPDPIRRKRARHA